MQKAIKDLMDVIFGLNLLMITWQSVIVNLAKKKKTRANKDLLLSFSTVHHCQFIISSSKLIIIDNLFGFR